MSAQYFSHASADPSHQHEYTRPRINRRESDGGSPTPQSGIPRGVPLPPSAGDPSDFAKTFATTRQATGWGPVSKSGQFGPTMASPVMPGLQTKCAHVQGVLQDQVWHCAVTTESNELFDDSLNKEPKTELRAGLVQKPFYVETELLVSKSPYFSRLLEPSSNPVAFAATTPASSPDEMPINEGKMRLSGPFFFPDLDEWAFEYFVKWLQGGKLHGPHDFHSMNHYLCLYVLAGQFEIEVLKNYTMDLVRSYYRHEKMTAPAFRLDYIYSYTKKPDRMREFLVTTAAFRALVDNNADKSEWKGISDSVKGVLARGGDVAADFSEALVVLSHNGKQDVRKGHACRWHEHKVTPRCQPSPPPEPYEQQ